MCHAECVSPVTSRNMSGWSCRRSGDGLGAATSRDGEGWGGVQRHILGHGPGLVLPLGHPESGLHKQVGSEIVDWTDSFKTCSGSEPVFL